jgi:hypothetical protein
MMRVNVLYQGILVAATLCVAPAALPASPRAGKATAGTVESGKGAFPFDASNLLQQVQIDALRVRANADQLQARLRGPFESSWEDNGVLLQRVAARVNNMDKLLSELRVNRSEALPWQQQAIDRIAPSVVNLTDMTEDAIVRLNSNPEHVYFSDLEGLAGDMYNEGKFIAQVIGNFEKYADASHEAQQLRQSLQLENNSR